MATTALRELTQIVINILLCRVWHEEKKTLEQTLASREQQYEGENKQSSCYIICSVHLVCCPHIAGCYN